MTSHRNFTQSYDTRGQTYPDYLNKGLDAGYVTAPFPRRYYDRPAGYSDVTRPATSPCGKVLNWGKWDPQAIADPAYFYRVYGTKNDPLVTSRDGIQDPYWGAEYADYPRVANRYYTNWIGREFWRSGKRGRPKGHGERKDFLAGVAQNFPIFEDQLPTPYMIISGTRGRMDLNNRLVQIPPGAIIIFLTEPQAGDSTAQYREYIEAVQIRSRPGFY